MTRLRVALAAVIAAALMPSVGVLVQLVSDPGMLRWHDDPISSFERHVASLRDVVRDEPTVGYLAPARIADPRAHLYALRYALAPVRVVDDAGVALVVADGVSDPRQLPPQLRVRRDFGGGLLLLERVPQ